MNQKTEVRRRQVGPWQMNTYALVSTATNKSVLIDPGADPETLTEMLAGTTPVAVLLTHTHHDHVGALDEMLRRLGVPLVAHHGPHLISLDKDQSLGDGDTFTFGDTTLHVYHAPGHIDDQICFQVAGENTIIVGDTIFEGGPGKTWSSEGFKQTIATLKNVVLQWPDDSICYPGHGPSFRLGDIRQRVEGFVARDHGEFYGDAEWEQ